MSKIDAHELEERLRRAEDSLTLLRSRADMPSEKLRLAGKLEGIRVALDYVRSEPAVAGVPPDVLFDVWAALGLPSEEFDACLARESRADLWSALLGRVRKAAGIPVCGKDADGEPCVLSQHSPDSPHWGASDVGRDVELPASGGWPTAGARPDPSGRQASNHDHREGQR